MPDAASPGLYGVQPDGTGLARLTDDGSDRIADWSADGTRVAFSRAVYDATGSYVEQIFVMNADGTGPRQLTDNADGSREPEWSPDGTRIAFKSGRRIWTMNGDGTDKRQISGGPDVDPDASDYAPTWSPGGTKLVFDRWVKDGVTPSSQDADLYEVDADGTNEAQLTSSPTLDDEEAAWSPDGKKLAVIVSGVADGHPAGGDTELELIDLADMSRSVLTNDDFEQLGPSWNATGEQIAYHAYDRAGGPAFTDVFTIASSGGAPVNVTKTPDQNEQWATWGPVLPAAPIAPPPPPPNAPPATAPGAPAPAATTPAPPASGVAGQQPQDPAAVPPPPNPTPPPTPPSATPPAATTPAPASGVAGEQPRNPAPPNPDIDGDGVLNLVDPDPAVAGTSFDDKTGTYGTFTAPSGLSVSIADAALADDGVTVRVGAGTGQVTLQMCRGGFTVRLSPGSVGTFTCGSITAKVDTGSVQVVVPGGTTVVSIPAGATGKVTDNPDGTYKVENLGAPGSGTVTVTADGRATTLAPNSSTTLVTAADLARLTREAVQASPKYAALSKAQRAAVDRQVTAIGTGLAAMTGAMPTAKKKLAVSAYKLAVAGLVKAGWLDSRRAATLTTLASSL